MAKGTLHKYDIANFMQYIYTRLYVHVMYKLFYYVSYILYRQKLSVNTTNTHKISSVHYLNCIALKSNKTRILQDSFNCKMIIYCKNMQILHVTEYIWELCMQYACCVATLKWCTTRSHLLFVLELYRQLSRGINFDTIHEKL